MDNLSAQQKLMGNMQATSAELLSGIMEERGRGFASDREAWAQLKEKHRERGEPDEGHQGRAQGYVESGERP